MKVQLMQSFFVSQGLSHVYKEIDELLKHGMEPVITLSHFEMPLHLAREYGGFKNRKLVAFFHQIR